MVIKIEKKRIGNLDNSKIIRTTENTPIREIDNTYEVIRLEIKISSLSYITLKLFDNINKINKDNKIKLIMRRIILI
jgi:hypothetical protein